MILIGWLALLVGGFGLTIWASIRSLDYVRSIVARTRVPPFVIGLTLMSVGTDLPEIANSLLASFAGHGDLNAGDSIGSTVTQATLVLGLLPFFSRPFAVSRVRLFAICVACMVALALGALLMRDGDLSRMDGFLLVVALLVGSALVMRQLAIPPEAFEKPDGSALADGALALLFMGLVGLGAAATVKAFVELSLVFGVPEYLLSFFVALIGTSLPELILDVMALRAGMVDLAIGDVLGSSFVDATLSIGIGPFVFPTAVSADLAVTGSMTAIAAMGLVGLTLALARRHGRTSGTVLILLYLGVYFVMLA